LSIAILSLLIYIPAMDNSPLWACKNAKNASDIFFWEYRMADDHCFYHCASNLMNYGGNQYPYPSHEWVYEGLQLKESLNDFIIHTNMGYLGFYAGPKKTIIDYLALTDPFLSHIRGEKGLLIGHNKRSIPAGYLESRIEGKNLIEDKRLKNYYKKILTVTRGKLFTLERWKYIIDLNLRKDRYYLNDYIVDITSEEVTRFRNQILIK
ncbi:MAG: hypothetical protein P9M03_12935, partial [Candidatus Theseobacter exili]|nr:hypothetical protein [Candidatus Theseobacter exili]